MKNPLRLFGDQWIAKTVVLAVVVAGTAGIAVRNLPEPADQTLPALASPDVANWAMPLDRYIEVNDFSHNYAELLLTSECMATRGVDWSIPWQDPSSLAAQFAGPEADVLRPTDATAAASRAYRAVRPDGYSAYLWSEFFSGAGSRLTDTESTVESECLSKIRRTVLPSAESDGRAQAASYLAIRLGNEAYRGAIQDPEVVATLPAWRSCLAAAGVPTRTVERLPPATDGVITAALRRVFGPDETGSVITTRETRTATADVACQTSSGYRTALYAAETARQRKVTASDLAVLQAAPVDQREAQHEVDRIVREHLPKEPAH